ncbi:MAG: putative metal-binding protein [Candidatus Methanohalarchaeum thermophilum]|uniref:Metal-binding protein n=1 Tax=Methanohalarchaeum thermophilum TaxID=1903181 RepID=A0A1Q6DSE1_METT1|nr:MAG: putative metal-binding protein [Candidatus Methanohalarchaeum thermophilum]
MREDLKKFEEAVEDVHEDFKRLSADEIVVSDWVRWKCKYGCKGYGKHFSCPPYAPTPTETRRLLKGYDKAYLFRFEDVETDSSYFKSGKETCYSPILDKEPNPEHLHHYFFEGVREVSEKMLRVERKAFLEGFYKAFSLHGLPCALCEECVIEELDPTDSVSERHCKNPSLMRPSMEGCGIDVFMTAENAGYDTAIFKSKEQEVVLYGLLLFD